MKCPRCSLPIPAPPTEIAPYSGAIERLWACGCGWFRLDFLGWSSEPHQPLQLAFVFTGV
jgi:hypothetical protein